MSLLMDALKRAETARQAEASDDGAGLGLAPVHGARSEQRPLPREPTVDEPVPSSDRASLSGSSLSLENTQAMHGRLGIEGDQEAASASFVDTAGRSLSRSMALVGDEDTSDDSSREPRDTPAGLRSVNQAHPSVDATGSAARDDPSAAMANEAVAPPLRVADDSDPQGRVRAVFHAKEASAARRGRNWVVMGLVPALLLVIVGGVVLVYWDSLNEAVSGKPALVQAPRTPPPAVEPAPQPATDPAPRAPTIEVAPVMETRTSHPAGGSGRATTVPIETDTSRGTQANMTEITASAPTVAQVFSAADEVSRRSLPADEQVALAIQQAGLAPASPTGGAAFKIKRETTPDKLHPRLLRGYDAWMSGNLEAAKRDYQDVLRFHPRNRSAILGLGAIAVREGRWDEASERYATLLRINPRDSVAQAGLIAVHENVDPLRGESQIKILLREEPDAPHLHFTLGNMYAEQNRWGEAQSAYFSAYRLQSDNPDYAYNLAVSLDQLGKAAAATDYYNRALDLAARNGAAFDQPSVRSRLLKLAFEDAAR